MGIGAGGGGGGGGAEGAVFGFFGSGAGPDDDAGRLPELLDGVEVPRPEGRHETSWKSTNRLMRALSEKRGLYMVLNE